MVNAPRVHDLVRVDARVARRWPHAPPWVANRLERTPWVVVRRETIPGAIAIGVRGGTRAERFAAAIAEDEILQTISPWNIVVEAAENRRLVDVFVLAVGAARTNGLRIAPVGSFGYELATRERTTHAASDLDLILDAADAAREHLCAFRANVDTISEELDVRIDVELIYPIGGVALREALDGLPSVLFKTGAGPQLHPCPV